MKQKIKVFILHHEALSAYNHTYSEQTGNPKYPVLFYSPRISRPRLLSLSMLVFSVCMMLSGLVTSYLQLLLLRMGLAAG